MSKNKMLPSGFYDLMFDEAKKDFVIKNTLISNLLDDGFEIVNTPVLEFRENYNLENLKNTFFTVDVKSGKDLVLRNDITLQIARLLETRLSSIDFPIKICYQGDVFVTKNDELYSDRQMTQAGFEIIESDERDELIAIAKSLELVKKISSQDFVFEVSLPGFAKEMCDILGLSHSEELQLAIQKKNISAIREILPNREGEAFCKILTNFNNLEDILQNLILIDSGNILNERMIKIRNISDFINNNFSNIEICYDLFGQEDSSYYRNLAFKIYSKSYSYPILRGGDYLISNKKAIGATFYINHLRNIV